MTPNPPNALSTLSEEELSALFAVEVARWKREHPSSDPADSWWYDEYGFPQAGLLLFASDATATLPFLSKRLWNVDHRPTCDAEYAYCFNLPELEDPVFAPTFARSAVIALLTAKRAETK